MEPLASQLALKVSIMMVVSAKSALPSARPAQISQPVSPATLLPPASINISAKAGVTHPARTPSSATPLLFAEVATRTARLV